MLEGFTHSFDKEKTQKAKPEKETNIETRVILEIMRHGKREKHPDPLLDGGPELKLTPEGRAQTDERGKELDPQIEVSLGWGSPRVRSQETAYRVMLADENLNPNETLGKIEERIDKELQGVGKKMIEDERLNFHASGPIGVDGKSAYHEGRYMDWVINDSDKSAIEKHDTESSTFTRMAGNVASIVQRYTKIGSNFNRIASKTDKYEESGNQLERYLGTHQGIAESFVAKVLGKVKGEKIKDEFVASVASGFDETEGVHIEIINKGDEQHILMRYTIKDPENGDREEELQFGSEILEEIIKDQENFEKEVLGE